jgi:tight adherence protein B
LRAGVLAVVVSAIALVAAGAASAGVRIAGVDTSGYPEVRLTVVAPLGSPQPLLRENGAPVAGLRGTNLGRDKSVVLAVDRSESMRGAPLAAAAAAARAFVAAAGPGDRFEVVAFGKDAQPLTRFSGVGADADAALAGLVADTRSGTALWDAVVRAATALRREPASGRVIVVATDGKDVSSSASFAQAVVAAHRAHAAVYPVGIGGADFDPTALRRLAVETGGTYVQAASSAELARLFDAIGRTLAHTWTLSYETAARPGDRVTLDAVIGGESGVRTLTMPSGGASTAGAAAPALLPASAWGSRLGPLVLAAAVGLIVLLAGGFAIAARNGNWLHARLAPHLAPTRAAPKRRRSRDGRPFLRGLFSLTEHALSGSRLFVGLQRLITRADLPLLAVELLYLCLGAAVVVGAITAIAGVPPLFALLLAGSAAAAPVLWVRRKASQRMKAFDNQLPDLLITIAASLKAGHSFRHAIESVVEEGAEPAAREFRRVLTDTRLGRPMDDALAEMGERIGSKNLSFVLTSVSIQRQIGGSLAGLFDMVAETVRQRQQFARKIRGLTAMGRMSAYVLGALPFGMTAAISLISPSYMQPLWHTSTGHVLVGVGLAMLATGGAVLKKIVSFKG